MVLKAARNERLVSEGRIGGIKILCETIPFFNSVSFGIWIKAGSRDESPDKSGLFHFLEHLVFKGVPGKNAREIAIEIDELGGRVDAFTSREVTCYSGYVVADRLQQAFDLVADLTLLSNFPEEEIERERSVVLEEIKMSQDNPSDYIHDRIYPNLFGDDSPLGRQITGTPETVNNIFRDDLIQARDQHYRDDNIVIAATGAVTHEQLEELVKRRFSDISTNKTVRAESKATPTGVVEVIRKPIEQVHLVIATPGLSVTDEKRNDLAILNSTLGDGVSSRLFQSVREELGLAYSVGSFYEQYFDTGFFAIYAATAKEKLYKLHEAITVEIEKMVNEGPTKKEVERAISVERDSIKMSYESLSSRMSDMADERIYFDKLFTLEESLAEFDAVTPDSVRQLADELLGEKIKPAILAIGPVSDF